ncbi:MAG: hypothetical protein KAR19_15915 [Bacteroidales bacterium]|nr:hypothetical protein [Bacteroidales bacterium]
MDELQKPENTIKHIKISTVISFAFLCFGTGMNLMAQTQISGYMDMGSNNVSDGIFIKTAGLVEYQFGKNSIETGLQVDLKSNNDRVFSGYSFKVSRQLQVKKFPFEIEGFCLWTPFSDVLRETNWGVLLDMKLNHFTLRFGTEFRSFAFTQKAIDSNGYIEDERIRENWNLVYSFGYHLKPADNQWNIGLSVTNIDYFIINQETNPVFTLRGQSRVSSTLNLFMEAWYKSAGAFNLSVNYFGFFFRTGIIWDIH